MADFEYEEGFGSQLSVGFRVIAASSALGGWDLPCSIRKLEVVNRLRSLLLRRLKTVRCPSLPGIFGRSIGTFYLSRLLVDRAVGSAIGWLSGSPSVFFFIFVAFSDTI